MVRHEKYLGEGMVPILRSSAVLRPEFFGGLVFNHFFPPEIQLDRIRYSIVCKCNGANTVQDIRNFVQEKTIHSQKYIKSIVQSTLSTLENYLLLYWRKEKLLSPRDFSFKENTQDIPKGHLSAPIALIWELTRACNLKCKHCFSSSGRQENNELTTNEVKKNIDSFAENRILYINFTGGEPLLRRDFFDILKYASTKNIFFDFSTNGYLLTDKTVSNLKGTNVMQVQVSVDGLEETHDNLRGVKGAFKRALKAIKLLSQANFDVVISCTVNRTNIKELPKLIDMALTVGASSFKTTLFIPIGQGGFNQEELAINSNDVQQLSLLMSKKKKELSGRLSIMLTSCYPWLLDESLPRNPKWLRSEYICCAAGTSNLFITSDGNVVPCPFLREHVLGNLRNDRPSDLWKAKTLETFRKLKPMDLKGKCKECDYLGDQCFGGCRAAALAYSDDLYGEDPFCWKVSQNSETKSTFTDHSNRAVINSGRSVYRPSEGIGVTY